MKLVRAIRIGGFRSIRDAELDSIGSLTALVGKNSSGKSNVLRALNLFFNGVVEGSKPVSFPRDHHARPQSRRKKRISVSVDFELPGYFKYRKQLDHLKALGSDFTITKSWELDERRVPFDQYEASAQGQPIANGPDLARQFLSLIAYRYVPNRSIPSQLLQDESQVIADSIFLRMKGDQHAAALLKSLGAAANRMLASASKAMEVTGSPLSSPSVATADTLGEMNDVRIPSDLATRRGGAGRGLGRRAPSVLLVLGSPSLGHQLRTILWLAPRHDLGSRRTRVRPSPRPRSAPCRTPSRVV